MIAKIAEIGCLGLFAVMTVIEPAMPTLPQGPLLQLGALGLVGFMVVQNYRQGIRLEGLIATKDAEAKSAHERANRLAAEFTDAMQNMAQALKDRPCIAGNSRIKSNPKEERPTVQT